MFAFSSDGQPVPGFPVALPAGFESGVDRRQARVVGDNVVLVYSDVGAGASAEEGIDGIADVLTVGPDGAMRHGATVPRPSDCCVVGPTGVAYGTNGQTFDDGTQTTSVVAFDAAGIRPGWPIELAGDGSMPSFVDSRVAMSASDWRRELRARALRGRRSTRRRRRPNDHPRVGRLGPGLGCTPRAGRGRSRPPLASRRRTGPRL